ERARIGRRTIRASKVLDAGLEELGTPFAALAEDLAQIGIAARCGRALCDVVEANGNGEFRPQAKRLARLAFGEEDAPAQILSRHVEERIGRLDDGDVRQRRLAFCEEVKDFTGKGRVAGGHRNTRLRAGPRPPMRSCRNGSAGVLGLTPRAPAAVLRARASPPPPSRSRAPRTAPGGIRAIRRCSRSVRKGACPPQGP